MSIAPGTPLVTNLHCTPPLTAKIKVTTLKQRYHYQEKYLWANQKPTSEVSIVPEF